ncbi:tape measure protein [Cellulosilyticum sp. WCF-2]|uniref:tape measure protein n=1 Tax=Cellulosilyticum sp. WCF-2 TaxID=2497860 RepID=UPI000F8E7EB1|nr:tape measure protein [Cellulosilyticum sp. WCF-2]QEH69913.1 tape measure protein [Cellulosilyticum sp. WCF-2]
MATIRTAIQLQDRFTPVIRNMSNALNMTLSSFEALQRASHNAVDTASIQAARQSLASVEVGINEIEQGIREASGQQQQFNNTVRGGGSAIDSMTGKIKSMVGAYVGIRSLGAGMQATDTYISNGARLDLINDGLQTQAELQDKIYQAAQRSRGEYNAMVNTVAKLGLLAGDAFKSNNELVAFTELMNKSFKISGASTQESTNAMYQLTQAMASGRLQGDEYRSIIENAPMLANAIADYCGVSRGELKELASDGAISADIIKAAVFSTADDIEGKFATLPMTFSDVWTSIKNTAVQQFSGLMQKVNGFLNSNTGRNMVNGISSAIGTLAIVLGVVLEMVMGVSTFFSDNWSTIEPIIWGIVGAFVVYNSVLAIYNTQKSITAGLEAYHAAKAALAEGATLAQAAATTTATGAQVGFNAALLACPITWIIAAIILVIVCIYAVVGAINSMAGTSISATGIIIGAFGVASAAIVNILLGVVNFIIGIGIELYNLIATFANFFATIFNNPAAAIIDLFAGVFDFICGIVESAAGMIDTILGTDMSGAIAGFRQKISTAVDDIVGDSRVEVLQKVKQEDFKLEGLDYKEYWNAGYQTGEFVDDKLGSVFKMPNMNDLNNNMPDYSSMGQNIDNIAGDTGKMSDSLDTSEEDLKYLRDIAEREAINRFTTAEIKVDMGGVSNTINNMQDLDGIADYLAIKVEEQMQIAAEGVHE